MNSFNYLVISQTNVVIAQFGELENAMIFVEALFNKYFEDTKEQYTIKRVECSFETDVYTVYNRIEKEMRDNRGYEEDE